MDEVKICTKCNDPKPLSRFRWRTKRGYTWQQGFCMDCEAKKAREYVAENLEIVRERSANRYRNLSPEEKKRRNKKRWLEKKGTEEWREYRKKYWRENEEQRIKHKAVARKSQIKKVETLPDNYILEHITQRTTLKKEDVPKELIEVVREIKLLKRTIKNHDKNRNSKQA